MSGDVTKFYGRKLSIFDENLNKIGCLDRDLVHREGHWHKGVQLNIISGDYILLQKRSKFVDISKELIDQTVATQLIDNDKDEMDAILRGTYEELGLNLDSTNLILREKNVKIIKTYDENKSIINREFVTLFEYTIADKTINPLLSEKTSFFYWEKISRIKKIVKVQPQTVTQTFRMWLERSEIK